MKIIDLVESDVSEFVLTAMKWTNNPAKVKKMALQKFGRKAKKEIADVLSNTNNDRQQRFG